MDTYDKAHELANLLAKSDEYKLFKKAKRTLEQDYENVLLLQTFRRVQMEIQMARITGEEIDEEYLKEADVLYKLLSMNSKVNEYLNAEYKLSRLMSGIQKILGDAMSEWFTIEPTNKNAN